MLASMDRFLGTMALVNIPEMEWEPDDDLCDCAFQILGRWTNPYIARTFRVRFCCLWKRLEEQFPECFQHVSAYHDPNTGENIVTPAEWNGEHDMPRAIWYRQLAVETGESLERLRERLVLESPPKGVPKIPDARVEAGWRKFAEMMRESNQVTAAKS